MTTMQNTIEKLVAKVLDNEVKDEFYWQDWYEGTLFINGMSEQAMQRVHNALKGILGDVRLNRMGKTDEYAFDFC
jgi:predicted transcriptional regulator